MLGASRQLIEWGIRQQVKQLPKVELMASVTAVGFSFDVAKTRVSGVIVESGSRQTQEEINADLVVDTTGRGSRTPQWLAEHGFPQPTETVVDGHLGYASRLVRPPASPRPAEKNIRPNAGA